MLLFKVAGKLLAQVDGSFLRCHCDKGREVEEEEETRSFPPNVISAGWEGQEGGKRRTSEWDWSIMQW